MRRINQLFSPKQVNNKQSQDDGMLNAITAHANANLHLQSFWKAAAPNVIVELSSATQLKNGELTISTGNATVATKIKLTNAMLLTQLQNLALSDPFYKECKVTSIKVKVQVKSAPKPVQKKARTLSKNAANQLESFANQLGDSTLAQKLKKLASKT